MLSFASPIVDTTALWKIILASLVGGAGVAIAFGFVLLGVSRAARSSNSGGKALGYLIAAAGGLFCTAAIVLGIYAMAKKPASPKPKKTSAALISPQAARTDGAVHG